MFLFWLIASFILLYINAQQDKQQELSSDQIMAEVVLIRQNQSIDQGIDISGTTTILHQEKDDKGQSKEAHSIDDQKPLNDTNVEIDTEKIASPNAIIKNVFREDINPKINRVRALQKELLRMKDAAMASSRMTQAARQRMRSEEDESAKEYLEGLRRVKEEGSVKETADDEVTAEEEQWIEEEPVKTDDDFESDFVAIEKDSLQFESSQINVQAVKSETVGRYNTFSDPGDSEIGNN